MKRILSLICGFLLLPCIAFGATSNIAVTEGSGKNIATNSITEDAATKQLQRVVPNTSAGVESGTAASPLQVSLANTGTNATPVVVDLGANNDVTVTGSVTADLGANNDVTVTNATAANCKVEATIAASQEIEVTQATAADLNVTEASCADILTDTGTIAGDTTSIDGKITACNTGAVVLAAGTAEIGKLAAGVAEIGNVKNSGTFAVQEASAADIKTAVQVIDNWDDSNYCNVNLNLAGTDADAGEGALSANTLRVSLATDDDGVAHLATIAGDTTSIDGKITACNTGAVVLAAGSAIVGAVKQDVVNWTPINKYYTNAGAVTDGIIWSPAAGKKWVITDLIINTSAAATITIENDLSAGDSAIMKFELAANGGLCKRFVTPWIGTEDDADLIVTTSAGNIYIEVTGYEID